MPVLSASGWLGGYTALGFKSQKLPLCQSATAQSDCYCWALAYRFLKSKTLPFTQSIQCSLNSSIKKKNTSGIIFSTDSP